MNEIKKSKLYRHPSSEMKNLQRGIKLICFGDKVYHEG